MDISVVGKKDESLGPPRFSVESSRKSRTASGQDVSSTLTSESFWCSVLSEYTIKVSQVLTIALSFLQSPLKCLNYHPTSLKWKYASLHTHSLNTRVIDNILTLIYLSTNFDSVFNLSTFTFARFSLKDCF